MQSVPHLSLVFLLPVVGALSCATVPSRSTRLMVELTRPSPQECEKATSRRELLCGTPSFVRTPTADVAYQRFGQGPALILIHGWPLHRLTWRNMIEANCVGVARVPNAKLLLHEERGEQVAAIVLAFLKENR